MLYVSSCIVSVLHSVVTTLADSLRVTDSSACAKISNFSHHRCRHPLVRSSVLVLICILAMPFEVCGESYIRLQMGEYGIKWFIFDAARLVFSFWVLVSMRLCLNNSSCDVLDELFRSLEVPARMNSANLRYSGESLLLPASSSTSM